MTTITVADIRDTQYGEKAVLDSPFESKQHIKFMPFSEDDTPNFEELDADTPVPDFDFSDDFASFRSWEPDALDGHGAWLVGMRDFTESVTFLESVGYTVQTADHVPDDVLR